MNLITLSIFGVMPNNGPGKTVNIHSRISDDVFFVLELMRQIKLFWHFIIVVNKKEIFIGKVFFMDHITRKFVQLIINLQTKMKIIK